MKLTLWIIQNILIFEYYLSIYVEQQFTEWDVNCGKGDSILKEILVEEEGISLIK